MSRASGPSMIRRVMKSLLKTYNNLDILVSYLRRSSNQFESTYTMKDDFLMTAFYVIHIDRFDRVAILFSIVCAMFKNDSRIAPSRDVMARQVTYQDTLVPLRRAEDLLCMLPLWDM